MFFSKKQHHKPSKIRFSQKCKKVKKKKQTFEIRAPYLGYLYVRIYVVISKLR
jgi:hypothetical protein